jgi:histidinol-phosphate phosphatase family protein
MSVASLGPHAPACSAPRRPDPAHRAVFIDKDGTLVHDVPYNVDPALLRWRPGALQALAALARAGFLLLLATNQSGLARGLFTRAQFARLQQVLEQRLHDEAGVQLRDVLVCPHAPAADGAPACLCRKPAPGLLVRAARQHHIDLAASWMVGDTLDDVEAGHRAGCRSVLLDSGGETLWRPGPLRRPDARLADWDDVAHRILADTPVPPVPPPSAQAAGVARRT